MRFLSLPVLLGRIDLLLCVGFLHTAVVQAEVRHCMQRVWELMSVKSHKEALDLSLREPLILGKITHRPVGTITPEVFQKTEEEFANETRRAHAVFEGYFKPIQNHPEAYRLDTRSPVEVHAAGGMFPNPKKPKGTVDDHVLGFGSDLFKYESTGVIHGPANVYVLPMR